MPPARVLAAVTALVVCGSFALAIRQSVDADAASSIIDAPAPLTAPRAAHASSLLRSAAFLNPDRSVDLLRSALALRLRHYARARALALSVTRSEPQNLQAWLAFGVASYGDRRAFLLALAQVARLAPPVKPAS
ncbi:MAG: hypothetical protein ACLP0J_14200 [Solirubrobacteraceae bacterium]